MKSLVRIGRSGKGRHQVAATSASVHTPNTRVEMIQALIPRGLEAVHDVLQQEVAALAGERYRRGDGQVGYARSGQQQGSVYVADQKVGIRVPRVRNLKAGSEVRLASHQALRRPRRADEASLRKVVNGLSCRDYEACVEPVAETFGLSGSSVSRRFKRGSAVNWPS